MNFDVFKNVKPDADSTKNVLDKITEKDAKYIEKLQKLEYKKSKSDKIIQIVSASAAALLIVTAVSLWAILGRGIRGIGVDAPTPSDSTYDVNIYRITVSYEGGLIYGQDSLQGFFDDFVSGKECVLEMTHMDRSDEKYSGLAEGEIPPLYVSTFSCMSDGSVIYKPEQAEGAYAQIDFAFEEHEFDHMKFVLDRDRNEYFAQLIDYDDKTMDFESFIPLSAVKNSHENSDRVYDSSKTQPVTVENGIVTAGEESLIDFFDGMINGYYVSADINGVTFRYRNRKDCMSIYENGVETEFSKRYKFFYPYMSNSDDNVWIGYVSENDAVQEIAELKSDEIDRLGLLFGSAQITVYDGMTSEVTLKDNGRLSGELKANYPAETQAPLSDGISYSIKLNHFITIYVYENEDGSISDSFGFTYPYEDKLRSVKMNKKFVQTVSEIISEAYGKTFSR